MLEIKKGPMTVIRTTFDIIQFTDTYDGIYFKFSDGVEIIIPYKMDEKTKAAIVHATRMNTKAIKLDLNNPSNPVQVQV